MACSATSKLYQASLLTRQPFISVHLLAKEIQRKVTAQSYLRKIHIFQNSLQQHARTIVLHLVVSIRRRLLNVSFLLCFETVASWRMSQKIQHYQCFTVCAGWQQMQHRCSEKRSSLCDRAHRKNIENILTCLHHKLIPEHVSHHNPLHTVVALP